MKDNHLLKFIDIYSYTTQEFTEYQEKMKKIFSVIDNPI